MEQPNEEYFEGLNLTKLPIDTVRFYKQIISCQNIDVLTITLCIIMQGPIGLDGPKGELGEPGIKGDKGEIGSPGFEILKAERVQNISKIQKLSFGFFLCYVSI